jgi:hypothetical protein
MKLNLKAHEPHKNNRFSSCYGTMMLKDNKLLKFIEDDESISYLKLKYGHHFFPIKPNVYIVDFLDETNENHKTFKAIIQIKDSFSFYVKLNWFQKNKLKWMHEIFWIQQPENLWKFIVFTSGFIIAIITLLNKLKVL